MAQIPYSTGIKPLVKPVAKPAGNPADRNFFSGSAVPIAPRTAPTVNMVRPPLPVAKPPVAASVAASSQPSAATLLMRGFAANGGTPPAAPAAPSTGRAMTVASPAALKLAQNLRINPNNPTAASSVPIDTSLNKPTFFDNLFTGFMRNVPGIAADFFPPTAALPMASSAVDVAGEKAAQQYEMDYGLRDSTDNNALVLAGAFGLLPFGLGAAKGLLKPGSKLFRTVDNAIAPIAAETFEAGTREALRAENIARFVTAFNEKTQQDILDRAGKSASKFAPSYAQAFTGVEMATTDPSLYGGGVYRTFTTEQMNRLRDAVRNGASAEEIADIKFAMTANPRGFIPYSQSLVDATKARYGPEQLADLKTIQGRIAQDQQYPLSWNTKELSAINALRKGKIDNIHGTKNIHWFNESPVFRPEEIHRLQQARLDHEVLAVEGRFPKGYGIEQSKANPGNHPIYTYHEKPDTGFERQMVMENARTFGPVTFTINDAIKLMSTTSPGDTVWRQNFLDYGNYDLEDIASAMNPRNIPSYTIPRVGQDPSKWDPRSFADSWSESQIMGGLSMADVVKATVRLRPYEYGVRPDISSRLKHAFDTAGMPYEVKPYPLEMGGYW